MQIQWPLNSDNSWNEKLNTEEYSSFAWLVLLPKERWCLVLSVWCRVNIGPVSLTPIPFNKGTPVLKLGKSLLSFHAL